MTKLEIIGPALSNYVWTVRVAAAEKGVPIEHVVAAPGSAEVRRINPLAKVPVMRHGDLELSESRAIAGYIDDAFDGPALFPKDPAKKARVEQWVSIINTSIDPVCTRQYLIETIAPMVFGRDPDQAKIAGACERMPALLDLWAAGVTDAGYLGSQSWSYADANATPILFFLSRSEASAPMVAARPKLVDYLKRMAARPSFVSTAPPRPGA